MKILQGMAIFKMTLTLTYDLDLGLFNELLLLDETNTPVADFFNRSLNKDFIGYAVVWPLKIKRFDLGTNACHFRHQRAKDYLHTYWFWAKSLLEFESKYEYDANFMDMTLSANMYHNSKMAWQI